MGKTSMKQLLMRGGDLQVLEFNKEDMAKVQKLAKKYGILYSIMPDLEKSKKTNKQQISQYSSRISSTQNTLSKAPMKAPQLPEENHIIA